MSKIKQREAMKALAIKNIEADIDAALLRASSIAGGLMYPRGQAIVATGRAKIKFIELTPVEQFHSSKPKVDKRRAKRLILTFWPKFRYFGVDVAKTDTPDFTVYSKMINGNWYHSDDNRVFKQAELDKIKII